MFPPGRDRLATNHQVRDHRPGSIGRLIKPLAVDAEAEVILPIALPDDDQIALQVSRH